MVGHTDPNTISFTESNAVDASFWMTGTPEASPRSSNSCAMPSSVTGVLQSDNQTLRATFHCRKADRKSQVGSREQRPGEGTVELTKQDEKRKEKRKKKESQQSLDGIIGGKAKSGGFRSYLYTIGPTSSTSEANGEVRREIRALRRMYE